ncbi:MAG: nucleotidyl transferase AbiEii/AbiGii toxin family protein [Bacteroidaceae bacterium]|nr:nucleotidyl transferase AbiEii/AbiGii toxin family protein [Bacteroidaceae bacterium]
MIDLQYIRGFFPPLIAENALYQKHMIKEYVELLALEWISRSIYAEKLIFIGGTNLRLIQGIDRFSEDLDFDCKGLSETEFLTMTDGLIRYLQLQGLEAIAKDKEGSKLQAYRRNVYFPELLFDLQVTGHRDERFLMKIEAQDQGIIYPREMATIQRLGFYFPVAVPPLSVLLSMKLSALIARQKGRDFYDTIFLWQRTQPDYAFLNERSGIANKTQLVEIMRKVVNETDLNMKRRDFEHLLFEPSKAEVIEHVLEIING